MTQPKDFIHENFLLETDYAQKLFHEYAKSMPIIDYHCHLPPADIAQDRRWDNITQIWLYGDHYKWRAMRSNGIDEKYCTGNVSDYEKFEKYAETMPYLLRNPLYHWSHLELKRYFGVSELLSPETCKHIWEKCNERINSSEFSARKLMKQSNVVLVCTTDDPTDTLEYHLQIAKDETFDIKVLPTWRPDKGMAVENPETFNQWVDKLAECTDIDIKTFDNYIAALRKRHDFFNSVGCRLSDHGIETAYAEDYSATEIESIFTKLRAGKSLNQEETLKFKSAMLYEFGVMDWEKGWTQQFHFCAMRNNNSRMFKKLGPDTGFDSIGDFQLAKPLSRLLDKLDSQGKLTKTILYTLNPAYNEVIATMLGNFQDASVPGKMQFGSGWWFLDQIDGMTKQMEALSNMGLLRRFVGMLTDSRSFLSYTRHEYFRRLLCNILGNDMARGLVPNDIELIGAMIRDISYNNAARYFGFDLPVKD